MPRYHNWESLGETSAMRIPNKVKHLVKRYISELEDHYLKHGCLPGDIRRVTNADIDSGRLHIISTDPEGLNQFYLIIQLNLVGESEYFIKPVGKRKEAQFDIPLPKSELLKCYCVSLRN